MEISYTAQPSTGSEGTPGRTEESGEERAEAPQSPGAPSDDPDDGSNQNGNFSSEGSSQSAGERVTCACSYGCIRDPEPATYPYCTRCWDGPMCFCYCGMFGGMFGGGNCRGTSYAGLRNPSLRYPYPLVFSPCSGSNADEKFVTSVLLGPRSPEQSEPVDQEVASSSPGLKLDCEYFCAENPLCFHEHRCAIHKSRSEERKRVRKTQPSSGGLVCPYRCTWRSDQAAIRKEVPDPSAFGKGSLDMAGQENLPQQSTEGGRGTIPTPLA